MWGESVIVDLVAITVVVYGHRLESLLSTISKRRAVLGVLLF